MALVMHMYQFISLQAFQQRSLCRQRVWALHLLPLVSPFSEENSSKHSTSHPATRLLLRAKLLNPNWILKGTSILNQTSQTAAFYGFKPSVPAWQEVFSPDSWLEAPAVTSPMRAWPGVQHALCSQNSNSRFLHVMLCMFLQCHIWWHWMNMLNVN